MADTLKPLKLAALVASSALLGACSHAPVSVDPISEMAPSMVEAALAAPAQKYRPDSLGADAAIKPTTMQVHRNSPVSVSFAGDARDLLRSVAQQRNMRFEATGPQPHAPLLVIVNMQDASFDAFLRDVGAQLGQRADLIINNSRIEVRYRDYR